MSSDEESISATSEEEEEVVVVKKKRKAKKKKKDPNKPKRNMSAFFLYSNANRERVKSENPEAKFGDIAKILSNEYKALPLNEKKQWEDLAEKDKERYKREMEDYEPPSDDSEDDGKRRKKKKKDPNAPKRNMSAFFLYSNANRNRVKQENPDAKFGDLAKIMSVEFKAISAADRAKWDQLAAEDKARYLEEMEDYEPPYDSSDDDSDAPRARGKKRKKKKDPNAPKRNQSSFFLYSNATRNDVKAANPEAKFGEIAQIISRHFKALPGEERAYWDEKAAEDKERYLTQKDSYEQTGTF